MPHVADFNAIFIPLNLFKTAIGNRSQYSLKDETNLKIIHTLEKYLCSIVEFGLLWQGHLLLSSIIALENLRWATFLNCSRFLVPPTVWNSKIIPQLKCCDLEGNLLSTCYPCPQRSGNATEVAFLDGVHYSL